MLLLIVCNYLMYCYWKGYVLSFIFCWTPELHSKFPWELNYDDISFLKELIWRFYTLSSTYHLLHLCIFLCNVSDLESYIFHNHRQITLGSVRKFLPSHSYWFMKELIIYNLCGFCPVFSGLVWLLSHIGYILDPFFGFIVVFSVYPTRRIYIWSTMA